MITVMNCTDLSMLVPPRSGSSRRPVAGRALCMVLLALLLLGAAGCSNDKPAVSREGDKKVHDYCYKSDNVARAVVKQLEAARVLDPGALPRSEAQRMVRPSVKSDVYLRWNLATYDAPTWSASADLLSYVVSRAVRKAGATLAPPMSAADTFVFTIGFSDRNLRGLAESLEVVRLVVPVRLGDEVGTAADSSANIAHDDGVSVPAGVDAISAENDIASGTYQDLVGGEESDMSEKYVPKEEPLAGIEPGQASRARARLAIVIDDLGNGVAGTEQLFRIEAPLTVAVLPDGKRAKSEATAAAERGFAVLLHQPMEPHDPAKRPGGGAIMTGMSEERIRQVLAANIAAVPNAVGVNNHMGSKVTEDRDAMITIMNEVFSRGLFFFDSRTTPNSAAPRVARDMGAPLLENARFLDHIADDEEYVVDQIRAAARIALSRGSAAVIGHVRPTTVRALARMIPELTAAGVQLVRLDELMPPDWKSTVAKLRKPTAEPTAEVPAGPTAESSVRPPAIPSAVPPAVPSAQPQPQPQPQLSGAAAPPQETMDIPGPAAVPVEPDQAAPPIQAQPVPASEAEVEAGSAAQPLPDDGQDHDSGTQGEAEGRD